MVFEFHLRIQTLITSSNVTGDPISPREHLDVILEGLPQDFEFSKFDPSSCWKIWFYFWWSSWNTLWTLSKANNSYYYSLYHQTCPHIFLHLNHKPIWRILWRILLTLVLKIDMVAMGVWPSIVLSYVKEGFPLCHIMVQLHPKVTFSRCAFSSWCVFMP